MMEKSRSDPAFQGEEVETGSFFKVWLSEVLSGVAILKNSRCSRGFLPLQRNRYRTSIPVPVISGLLAIWVVPRNLAFRPLEDEVLFYLPLGEQSRTLLRWAYVVNLGGTAE
ncbi:hypothetical protein SAMN02745123_03819 [Desulforamulus aeronauticus DSM 10349]|uniref:Uncharacterized protein n=1 Tax=Desulforamulus aeronauticus DSM 10349 TaxID=1121421 RepID=A0A1M6WYV6_9FIRM|nr:hypothetical protein SAMN02745123_03819 [Desulforamulus aeronauticus DSM 10349]